MLYFVIGYISQDTKSHFLTYLLQSKSVFAAREILFVHVVRLQHLKSLFYSVKNLLITVNTSC